MMTVVVWVGAAATFVTSLSILWKKLVQPIIAWGVRLDRAVSFVEQQMVPNGGTSVRDALNRIEQRLTSVEDHITRAR